MCLIVAVTFLPDPKHKWQVVLGRYCVVLNGLRVPLRHVTVRFTRLSRRRCLPKSRVKRVGAQDGDWPSKHKFVPTSISQQRHPFTQASPPSTLLTTVALRHLLRPALSASRTLFRMPPKQTTLGYVKPSQTTLGCVETLSAHHQYALILGGYFQNTLLTSGCSKFFTQPNGAKKPALTQQTKLSFSTKPSTKTEKKPAVDDVEDGAEVTQKPEKVAKETAKVEAEPTKGRTFATELVTLAKPIKCIDARKRGRPPATKNSTKKEPIKKEEEQEDKAADDAEDVTPASKRPRRGRRVIEDDDDEIMEHNTDVKVESKASSKPQKDSKSKTAKQKIAEPPVVETPEAEEATESASEVEEELEDEDDEDENGEVVAKARKTVQAILKSTTKDPYPDWRPGEPVPYAALCKTFSLVELTTKRLIIMEYCALFLRQVMRLTPEDLLSTVLLMINKLAPDYAGIELGIGESLIMKAIGESTGRSLAVIKQDQKEIGDLGLVAVKSRSTQPTMFKPKALTIQGVHKGLMGIATVTGNGAQGRKVDIIKKLLSAADAANPGKVDITKDKGGPSEAKFIVRFLEGKLRLGLAERTVLVSLAHAIVAHEASKKNQVPSTADIEKAESILKTVYRFVNDHPLPHMRCKHVLKFRVVSCQATMLSFQPWLSMA